MSVKLLSEKDFDREEEVELFAEVISKPASTDTSTDFNFPEKIDGVVIGELVEVEDMLIDFPGNPMNSPIPSLSTCKVRAKDVKRKIALAFQEGDPIRPVILGFIQQYSEEKNSDNAVSELKGVDEIELDGYKVTFNAKKEIVFRCGEASITLTKAGKILIRGTYVVSRSSGVNKIKGGSVQIN